MIVRNEFLGNVAITHHAFERWHERGLPALVIDAALRQAFPWGKRQGDACMLRWENAVFVCRQQDGGLWAVATVFTTDIAEAGAQANGGGRVVRAEEPVVQRAVSVRMQTVAGSLVAEATGEPPVLDVKKEKVKIKVKKAKAAPLTLPHITLAGSKLIWAAGDAELAAMAAGDGWISNVAQHELGLRNRVKKAALHGRRMEAERQEATKCLRELVDADQLAVAYRRVDAAGKAVLP